MNRYDYEDFCTAIFIFLLLSVLIIMCAVTGSIKEGQDKAREAIRCKAILNGSAFYTNDVDGKAVWKWRGPNTNNIAPKTLEAKE